MGRSEAAIISQADALICADNFSQLTGLIAAWNAVAETDVIGVAISAPEVRHRPLEPAESRGYIPEG